MKSLRRDPDNREGMPINRDVPSNHIWIPVESLLPEVVVKNHHRVAIENLAFAPQKKPPCRRRHAQRFEEITADIGCRDASRLLPFDGKSVYAGCDCHHIAERGLALSANRFEFGQRERTLQGSVVLAEGQGCYLLGIRYWKRFEQDGVHQAENCRVGADAERQRQHRGYCKSRRPLELTKGEAEIVKQDSHGV